MSDAPKLFFVIGVPKSGTTWLGKLIDAHPHAVCKGEGKLHYFRDRLVDAVHDYNRFMTQRNTEVFGEPVFPKAGIEELDAVFRAFVEARLRHGDLPQGTRRLGTKDPDIGLNLPDFAAIYPDVDYLHIIRDPRDAALSMWHHMHRVHPGADKRTLMDSLNDTARGWSDYIRISRDEAKARGLSYREVRYEDLIVDGPAALKGALEFLGLDASDEVVARCLGAGDFKTLSKGREAGQIDAGSFYRKGVAGGWRDELTEAQGREVLAAAGPAAAGLGYV